MKKTNLFEELSRMKQLAGLLKEEAHLEAATGMLLKLDDSVKNQLKSMQVPQDPEGNQMTKLPDNSLHVTLTSIKNFKPYKDAFEDFVPETPFPEVKLGEAKFVYRDEIGKATYVVSVENQQELRDFVDSVYEELGLQNPEPNRFFHITLANNKGGNSFESIGNVMRADFA
jgi:2'-5' RNA ligase